MKQTASLRCFLTQERVVLANQTLNSENDSTSLNHVRVVVDHTLPIQLQSSAKLKISH